MAEGKEVGVIGGKEIRQIQLVEYDEQWPLIFKKHAHILRDALGDVVVDIEHIGSTSVPGLAAKPIIDMLLIVNDSGNESDYLAQMETAGYTLRVREPDFHEHRMFRTSQKDIHIHVLSQGSLEIDRYLVFRNQLRSSEDDCKDYQDIKIKLASSEWTDMNEYARAKTQIVERIIQAGFDNDKMQQRH